MTMHFWFPSFLEVKEIDGNINLKMLANANNYDIINI